MKWDEVLQKSTWLSAEDAQAQMPTNAWNLISYSGSLTEHFRTVTQGVATLRLLFANWGRASSTERKALNLAAQERTWIRCVEHRYDNNIWVCARAVFPEATIKATETISTLGVQALGDIIFKDPNIKREPFSYALLDKLWARQSILHFQQHLILITEIFMPEAYA